MHIRKDDVVEVLSGDDKGKRGKVVRLFRSTNKVVVEGVNRVYKPPEAVAAANPQGGRLSKEMPVDMSNVALIDPTTNKLLPRRGEVPRRRLEGAIRQEERRDDPHHCQAEPEVRSRRRRSKPVNPLTPRAGRGDEFSSTLAARTVR